MISLEIWNRLLQQVKSNRTLETRIMNLYQITAWSHELFRLQVKEEGVYIDATMGNGHDTLFLCQMAGEKGRVMAFDIQEQALEATDKLLREHQMRERASLYLESHTAMDCYAEPGSVDGIIFNFGYLPGGDHALATRADTSVEAVSKGLVLLKKGGVMALCTYSGGDTGYEEKDKILEYLRVLDEKKYLVIVNSFYNRKKDPPLPVFVVKK